MELNVFVENYIKENHPEVSDKVQNELGNAIRAGYYFAKGKNSKSDDDGDDGVSEVSADNLYLINKILGKANLILNSKDLSWEEKYDLILSDKISVRVNHLFDYYDPDTTYEEDVCAFMNGFREYVENRNKLSKYN